MPASTRDPYGPSPTQTPSATSDTNTPSLGRNSRPSTRRGTPVGTPGATTVPRGAQHNSHDDATSNSIVPAPAQTKPSYREYDSLATPSLSTVNMHPLGEMPTAKALEQTKRPYAYQPKKKTKGKQGQAAQASQTANGNGAQGGTVGPAAAALGARQVQADKPKTVTSTPTTTSAPVSAPISVTASSTSARTSGSPAAPAQTQTVTPSRPQQQNPWISGTAPSFRTAQGRQRLAMVVEAAVHRSKITGNNDMGRAIKKLYDESLTDQDLAELLDAVLAQRSTPQQFQQFQSYVRAARANPGGNVESGSTEQPTSTGSENGMVAVKTEPETPQPQGFNNGTTQQNGHQGTHQNGNQGTHQNGHQEIANKTAEPQRNGDVDSDHAVSPGTVSANVATQSSTASTPQPDPTDSSHLYPKYPSYEELKQDSYIRNDSVKPGTPARTRGKKRVRSPSPAPSANQPSPAAPAVVAAATGGTTTPTTALAAVQTPALGQQQPKKKYKTNKTKVS
jgi:hypothetical protein